MKKCAYRIGVASDLYKGMIKWDKQRQAIIVPDHYQPYYQDKGWAAKQQISPLSPSSDPRSSKKSELTAKLKRKTSAIQNQIKTAWQELAGNIDGLDEWYVKKREENVTDQQMINFLPRKLQEKHSVVSA